MNWAARMWPVSADLMTQMLAVIQRRRLVLNIPFFVARVMAFGFDTLQALTLRFGEKRCDHRAIRCAACAMIMWWRQGRRDWPTLGIAPTPMAAVLPEYLWRYRPSGQYAAIKDSAKNLRKT